jgi:hypothetical protein
MPYISGKINYEGGDPACWRRYSAGMCKCGVLCAGDEDAYVSEIPKIVNKVTITLKEMKIKKENHLIRRPAIKFSTVICSV